MRRIIAREEVCIGCRLCEVWCLVQHSKSKDIIKAFKRETPRAMARVHVEERGADSFALQCRHCEEPYCVYSCISGAMYIDEETGTVQHDPEK
jgi:carbon-monoxide dehydrogenase iron sulfur subunit